jgi:hypothetical protein
MSLYYPPTANGLQKTLGAQLDTGVTSAATLNNTTSIQNKPGVFVVDRVDTGGVEKDAAVREYISFAGVSGSTVTTLVRGLGGTTDQDHAVGAVVEFVMDVVQFQGMIDALAATTVAATGALDTTKVVDLTTAQTLTTKTLTTPVIASFYQDAGRTKLMTAPNTANDTLVTLGATQTLTAKTLTSPVIQTTLVNKGEYDAGNSGTGLALDWSHGDRQKVTISGDGCAFTFSNAAAGQTLTLRVVVGAGGHTAWTWPTLKWPSGAVATPVLTAAAINLYIFYFDGTNYLAQAAVGFA